MNDKILKELSNLATTIKKLEEYRQKEVVRSNAVKLKLRDVLRIFNGNPNNSDVDIWEVYGLIEGAFEILEG